RSIVVIVVIVLKPSNKSSHYLLFLNTQITPTTKPRSYLLYLTAITAIIIIQKHLNISIAPFLKKSFNGKIHQAQKFYLFVLRKKKILLTSLLLTTKHS